MTSRVDKISRMLLSCMHQNPFMGQEISCTKTIVWEYSKKEGIESLQFPCKIINWHGLDIAHFRFQDCHIISEKSIMMCKHRFTKAHKKSCTRISNSFSPEINFIWTSGFYRCEHLCTYRRQEFQNILERKLCNCFGQLLHVY